MLSLAFLYPDEAAIRALRDGAAKLSEDAQAAGCGSMPLVLTALANRLGRTNRGLLEREHAEVFGHTISTDCAPYEAEYDQAHVFQKSQTLADLGTFYRAFDLQVSPELKDRLDHISVEMEFMHFLTLKEIYGRGKGHGEAKELLCRQAQEAFLAHHLAGWVPAFAHRLTKKAPDDGIYAALADLLDTFIVMELRRFNLDPIPPNSSRQYEDERPDQEGECGAVLVRGDGAEEAAVR